MGQMKGGAEGSEETGRRQSGEERIVSGSLPSPGSQPALMASSSLSCFYCSSEREQGCLQMVSGSRKAASCSDLLQVKGFTFMHVSEALEES